MKHLTIILAALLLTSCHLATKGDIADLHREILESQEEATEEVRTEIRELSEEQAQQAARLEEGVLEGAEAQAARIERVEGIVLSRIPEDRGLAGMVAAVPVWGWYGIEFVLVAGFFMVNMVVASWRDIRVASITRDETGALTLVDMIVQKILSRRPDPLEDPEPPEPPEDDGPQLRVVK